ncbi:hypothetical protein D3C86_1900800 [compost metagenome]
MENITEMKKPAAGKAYKAISLLPNKASESTTIAINVAALSTTLESHSFSKASPSRQPSDISPQNQATACAPSLLGSA